MNDERQNAFEKAQPRTTLAEDQKNRFTKHDENRAAQLKKSDTLQERIDRRENQRKVWLSGGRTGTARSTSVLLDAKTQTLRDEMAAEKRRSQAPPAAELSDSTVYAIAQQWMADHPNFYRSAHNGENFKNFLCHQISLGKLTWNCESFSIAHDWLESNGYFEKAPARKRREFATTCSPRTYPKFVSDAERVAEDDRQRIEQTRRIEQEISRALSLPFDQLRKEVRGSLNAYGTQEVR